jgi:hypothetical protein
MEIVYRVIYDGEIERRLRRIVIIIATYEGTNANYWSRCSIN